ncbi:hypothetical protein B7P43_G13226 [Cryptotermes secundus]|uniref:Mos1 transposase HTH domain-containing protein n=1 Tax=Cryptotermes secundus TaxID=105785 RepID=A0A2J7RKZ2_9NEOP|nr:hypothetical protein B7P43_G13226 [Cryptotermes secundus]
MAGFREQRAAVKFCFLLGKSGTETLEMLKTAYKDDAMGKTQVFEWFSRFKNGEMSIDDKPRSGRPSTARTHENDWLFLHDNAPAHTEMSVRQLLTKNGMTSVPHPPYSPDLAPCDFFFVSSNEKRHERKKRRRRCQASQKMNLDNVLKNGIKD